MPSAPLETTAHHRLALAAAMCLSVLLLGCSEVKDKAAVETVARIDKDEITLRQINFVLQQQRGLKPEQTEAAGKQVLERLIDQQVALRKAEAQKIDRDPGVIQAVEAARRDIVARAYLEKVGATAPKPSTDEIKKYYDEKPALFRERRIYSIQEISIDARPEQVNELRDALAAAKNINDFTEFLKAKDYRFNANQAVRAAEQLPLNNLDAFAKMKDGQAALVPAANGVQVVVLAGSRSQPVSEEQARPAIEQFILNERKRKLIENEVKALRAAAKIVYAGKFADGAASATPAAGAGTATNHETGLKK